MRAEPVIMAVYGTRPEAIKLAPVIRALYQEGDLAVRVVVTGQHQQMLQDVNRVFGITPDIDLNIGRPEQTPTSVASAVMTGLTDVLNAARPDAILVHGDTTTSTAAALAAYYAQTPVIHLEAGLRSGQLSSPFPEEGNRRLTAQITALHVAPTPASKANLMAENVSEETIAVTGNTVIDALLHTLADPIEFTDPRIRASLDAGQRLVLVTGHRRESWDTGLAATARAIALVLAGRPDVTVVAALHPNPLVRAAFEPALAGNDRVILTGPIQYPEFCHLLNVCSCIVTDSGGIQEEAPTLGKPVLVTRNTTERPEAIRAGTVRLVGTNEDRIAAELGQLLSDPVRYRQMSQTINPYGDGQATNRVIAAIKNHFGLGDRLPDFDPDQPS